MERLVFGAYLVLLGCSPFPAASNRIWAWTILECMSFLLLALCFLLLARGSIPVNRSVKSAKLILLLLMSWLGFLIFQVLPLPEPVLRFLSPAAATIHDHAFAGGFWKYAAISLVPERTITELLKYSSYVSLFALTLLLVNNFSRLKLLLLWLVGVGFIQALAGFYGWYFDVDLLAWDPDAVRSQDIPFRGTFANRNHFAAHTGMAIAAGLGYLLATRRTDRRYVSLKARVGEVLQGLMRPRVFMLMSIAVLLGALVYSSSRGGNLAFFSAVFLTIALGSVYKKSARAELKVGLMAVAVVLAGAIWVGTGDLGERIRTTTALGDERVQQWLVTLPMTRDFLILGTGAGTYEQVFAVYRDGSLRAVRYNHAHNDYLELVSEQGVIGGLLIGFAVALALLKTFGAYARRRHPVALGALFASLVAVTTILIHGLLDYNFHIPANAAWFFVLLGVGIAAGNIERVRNAGFVKNT